MRTSESHRVRNEIQTHKSMIVAVVIFSAFHDPRAVDNKQEAVCPEKPAYFRASMNQQQLTITSDRMFRGVYSSVFASQRGLVDGA